MNTKLINKYLEKADWVKSAKFDPETNSYTVSKRKDIKIDIGKSYIIELDDSLLVNNGDEVLQYNWNLGKIPNQKFYKIDVLKILGGMIQCFGIGYDPDNDKDINSYWKGYLPKNKIKIITVL